MFFSYVEGEESSTLPVGSQWAVFDSLRQEEETSDLLAAMAARLKVVVNYASLPPSEEAWTATWDGHRLYRDQEDFEFQLAAALSMLDRV